MRKLLGLGLLIVVIIAGLVLAQTIQKVEFKKRVMALLDIPMIQISGWNDETYVYVLHSKTKLDLSKLQGSVTEYFGTTVESGWKVPDGETTCVAISGQIEEK